MKAYTVHAPPGAPEATDRFAFVKDGFSWPAFVVPLLWTLWHKMWLTLIGYIIFVLLLAWIDLLISTGTAMLVGLIGSFFLALEANNFRRRSLDQRGWIDLGASSGRDLDEAEIRFFQGWTQPETSRQPPQRPQAPMRNAVPPRSTDGDEQIIGLFPEPER